MKRCYEKEFPLISVIMPVYNAYEYLKNSMESLLNQTYKKMEIILVNDASTDGSDELCDHYSRMDNRVIVLHQKENRGQAAARNAGVKIANGIFIGFMDDDDLLCRNMYEVLVMNMLMHDVDISMCARLNIDLRRNKRFISDKRKSGLYDGRELLVNCLRVKGFSGAVWDKLFKREILERFSFPEGKELEDYWVVFRAFYEYRKVYYDEKPMYMWYIRENSQSHRGQLKNIDSVYEVADNLYLFYKNQVAEKEILDAAIYYKFLVCNGIIKKAIKNRNIKLFRKYWILSRENYKLLPRFYDIPFKEKICGNLAKLFTF